MSTSERCYDARCKLHPKETIHVIRVTFLKTCVYTGMYTNKKIR